VGGYLILVDNSLNITREWHTSVLSVLPHFFCDYILDDGQIHLPFMGWVIYYVHVCLHRHLCTQ
jgi:hypothetical protein